MKNKNNKNISDYFNNINFLTAELSRQKADNLYLWQKIQKIQQSVPWKCYKILKYVFKHPVKMIIPLIPLTERKKIASTLSKIIIFNHKNNICYALKQEWKKYTKTQPKNIKHDILVFGLISWDFRFQRPQQLSTELSKLGHRVFYIEHEFDPQRQSRSGFQAITASKIADSLYKIKISSGAKHFIYSDQCNPKDVAIMAGSIKTLFKEARILNPLAIVEHPFWNDLVQSLSIPFVYDCMDNHAGFKESSPLVISKEKDLISSSKLNITTSDFLERHLKKLGSKNNLLISNGVNLKHFRLKKYSLPQDIVKLSHPIIGYYGAISDWFDDKLLQQIAISQPKSSIVLIGNVANPKVKKLSQKYTNIKLLGEKSYDDIPKYLSAFDVCLIPFKLNPLIKATNPVKIYEYFAQNKPVVTTNLPELLKYQKLIYLSKTSVDFVKNIDLALKEDMNKTSSRIEIAKSNQWINKAKELSLYFNTFFPKVSIVILVYNSPQMSRDSIDTVLNRSFYPNFELIVVDNASKPDTVRMLKKYQNHSRVKLILNKENYGFAKGNNIGTRLASGDFIVLLNNDILATPGWIERLVFHASKPKIGLVGPVTNSIGNEAKIDIGYDHTNRHQMERRVRKYTIKHWGKTLNLNNIAAFCWICPKPVYDKVGELDERFGRGMFEDDDYCHRVKEAGFKILCIEDAFIHHFGGASFKQIVSQEYLDLFESNKKKFESKWKIKWVPHRYRQDL